MKRHILSTDLIVISDVILLMSAGLVSLTSASQDIRKLTVQTFCMVLGFILIIAVSFWDYRSVTVKTNQIYFLCIFFLAIVFPFGIGKEETGAISWIRFGSIGVQPSEFVKLLFSLYISCELSAKIEKGTLQKPKELIKFLLKCSPIISLVILQNDTGTALVFVFMLAVTLFVAGIKLKYILFALGITIIFVPILWMCLADYQRDRILVFFNPEANLNGAGYQVYLSKLALSSGGVLGQGYKGGAVNALSFLPEKDTDFIFSVIGEEFGLIGTLILMLLFLVLILRCFFTASHASDLHGKLIVTSICSMLFFHIAENTGMTLGLLPVTGIPLPFISYGGSSMISMSIGVGLILSVRRKTYNLHYI